MTSPLTCANVPTLHGKPPASLAPFRPGGDRSDIAGPTRLYPRTGRKLQGEPLSEESRFGGRVDVLCPRRAMISCASPARYANMNMSLR